MTNECWICGKREAMPYTCRYCGKTYCADHRLPEQHGCAGFYETARDENPGTYGSAYQQDADVDKFVKDMLKKTAKNAAKGAAVGIFNRIKRSIYTSPSMLIIYICIVSFFLESMIDGYVEFFQLYPSILMVKPWTLITHIFLHGSFGHLFVNMIVLFFFGRELERRVGNRMFLNIFFISGIVAAIGYTLTGSYPMIGASGAIYGVFACMAVLAPEMQVYVLIVPMRIKYAIVLFAFLDFIELGSPDMIAHTAHLSGLFIGLIIGMKIKKAYGSRRFGAAHEYNSGR
ncbi:MAG: rhomboid family intramembrane serine protease [Methanosarcinaceae archaeon]